MMYVNAKRQKEPQTAEKVIERLGLAGFSPVIISEMQYSKKIPGISPANLDNSSENHLYGEN